MIEVLETSLGGLSDSFSRAGVFHADVQLNSSEGTVSDLVLQGVSKLSPHSGKGTINSHIIKDTSQTLCASVFAVK